MIILQESESLRSRSCRSRSLSVGAIVGGADFASFEMVMGYLLLESTGAVGAVGFYEHIAGVVFSFFGPARDYASPFA